MYLLDIISKRDIKNKELILDIMPCSKKLPPELRGSNHK